MSKIYKIYHLPHYVWKDGSIGKIGVTSTSLKQRFRKYKNQNLSDSEILEEHNCKFKVSDKEIELQKQYGYPVDKILYWKSLEMHSKQSKAKGGKTTGRIHASSGHMDKMRELSFLASKKTLLQYNKDGNFIKEWFTASVACRELNLNNGHISDVCNGKRKSAGGFVWKYKNN